MQQQGEIYDPIVQLRVILREIPAHTNNIILINTHKSSFSLASEGKKENQKNYK